MKKLVIILVAALSVAAISAQAQTSLEGKLMRMSDFSTTDMINMSQYNTGYTTARSSAMGGAFTSLGADLSSMGINPAGLGMYRGSEFGLSLSVMSSNTNSKVPGGFSRMNDKTKFALNNLGFAFNIYQGTGALTSFTLGLGYNKLADFNYNTGVRLADDNSTINQIFQNQLRGYSPSILGRDQDPFDNYNIDVLDWGSVLAYQAGVLDPITGDAGNKYALPGWTPATTTTHFLNTVNKGNIGEYSLSGGMNFSNFFYLGFALGIQDISYEENSYYDERYPGNAEDMNFMLYDQRVKFSGSGVNFKLGAIIRPIDGLRIGLAVHTPTYVSLNRGYSASMTTEFRESTSATTQLNRETTNLIYDYKYNSPTRLLTGISYTMPNVGVLSFDYERVWYNGMRLSNSDSELRDEWKTAVKEQYQAANNFKAGIEVKPIESIALRAGYAYYGSVTKDNNRVFYQPITTNGYNLSAGIGYRHKGFSLDFAYIYMHSKLSAYDLYYYKGPDDTGATVTVSTSDYIETTRTRNNFTLSVGLRF